MIILQKGILQDIVDEAKGKSKQIVFTNGCFDIIHHGHIQLLEYCKMRGDMVIVGMNSDESVKRLKGLDRPIIPEKQRAMILDSIRFVDHVFVFEEDDPTDICRIIKPSYLVKGGDWSSEKIAGEEYTFMLEFFPFVSGQSTSTIIEKIKRIE